MRFSLLPYASTNSGSEKRLKKLQQDLFFFLPLLLLLFRPFRKPVIHLEPDPLVKKIKRHLRDHFETANFYTCQRITGNDPAKQHRINRTYNPPGDRLRQMAFDRRIFQH